MAEPMRALNQAIVFANDNPILVAVGFLALVILVLVAKSMKDGGKSRRTEPVIESHDRVDFSKKTKPYYEKKLAEEGRSVDVALRTGEQNIGKVTKITELEISKDLLAMKMGQNSYGDDDEEDERVPVYVMKIKPESKIGSAKSYVQELINNPSQRHIRIHQKKWLEDTGKDLYLPNDVEVMDMGGLKIEKNYVGVNMITEPVLVEALEKNLNNIDEYVKKINHWSDNYSQDMGRYEKEIEADERKYGGKLGNR